MRPVPLQYPITQSFGVPNPRYIIGYHTGTDFGCPVGTPVVAPFSCMVTKVSYSPADYGHYVILTGVGKRRAWLLAHLSIIGVTIGQPLHRGQVIGKSGDSGNVTGPHLHAEERHPPFGYRDCQMPTAWRDPGAVSHG